MGKIKIEKIVELFLSKNLEAINLGRAFYHTCSDTEKKEIKRKWKEGKNIT
jgi:hypothetical protein